MYEEEIRIITNGIDTYILLSFIGFNITNKNKRNCKRATQNIHNNPIF